MNKTLSYKYTAKPWISEQICVNIKKTQNYYSLVRQTKMLIQFYARFRHFVTNQIRHEKKSYKFEQFMGDCKNTWKQINNIIRPTEPIK